MGKYFNNLFLRDSLWVLGINVSMLLLFIAISFKLSFDNNLKEYHFLLRDTEKQLEKKLDNYISILKLMKTRVQSLEPNFFEKKIPLVLNENYSSLLKISNDSISKYYIDLTNPPTVLSALGKAYDPSITFNDFIERLETQKTSELVYANEKDFYIALSTGKNGYLLVKFPNEELLNIGRFQDFEIVTSDSLNRLPIQKLQDHQILDKNITYKQKPFQSYVFLKNYNLAILLPPQAPYTLWKHLIDYKFILMLIVALGVLFLTHLAFVYKRMELRFEKKYHKEIEAYKASLVRQENLLGDYIHENKKLLALQNYCEETLKTIFNLNARFYQLGVEILEISKILIQHLTMNEQSKLSLADQLRLSVGVHDNAHSLINGMIKFNTFKTHQTEDLIRASLALCERSILKNNIRPYIEIQDSIREIYVDELYFTQLLTNLFHKSLERVPKDGTIKLLIEKVMDQGQSSLKLTIEDDGFILDEKNLKRFLHKKGSMLKDINPLNLPWSSIEVLIHQIKGNIQRKNLDSRINITELIIPLRAPNEQQEVESNIVKLFEKPYVQ